MIILRSVCYHNLWYRVFSYICNNRQMLVKCLPVTVPFCNCRTQRHLRAAAPVQSDTVSASQRGPGGQQSPAAHPGRHRHPEEIPGTVRGGSPVADNRRPQDRAASPPVSVPPPSQAKPSAPLPRQEPVMRRWPRPAQQLPIAEEDPMQRYIRCSLLSEPDAGGYQGAAGADRPEHRQRSGRCGKGMTRCAIPFQVLVLFTKL